MKNFFKRLFGDDTERTLRRLTPIVSTINEFEETMKGYSDDELRLQTTKLKERLSKGETLDAVLPEAFATVREASVRTLGQRHFDVQLIGGMVLHDGNISEMRTGEGKTLVATLPAYLNALTGRGVHIVTVNDHLARRDAVWMGQIYSFLGLSVGVVNMQDTSYLYDAGHRDVDEKRDELGSFKVFYEFLRPSTKKEAYGADITYGTNSEFGFDYLRDNTQYKKEALSQRGHAYAIVDEVDSILIDEARVPLILSTFADEAADLYVQFARIAKEMKETEDYSVDEKLQAIQITDTGITKAERLLNISNLYSDEHVRFVHHLETAIRAKALFHKDKRYVVREGAIVLVDEFTGRMTPGRRMSEGLHQALEAKEDVRIQQETKTLASITYQNYFKFYEKLAGMTGTAETSSEEFHKVYGLEVIAIPTNRPVIRVDHGDYIFQTEKGKLQAVARKVKELHSKGQPVLVGTASIEKNEIISSYLTTEGIPHHVLNAKNHEKEAEITAQAGQKGAVTVATNMAGRGIDIKLGGIPEDDFRSEEIKSLGGLYVLGTERHEARRIDNQLRGRSGRQGDPGETQFYVSLQDDLMRVFGGDKIVGVVRGLGLPEDEPIRTGMVSRALETAQKRIEGFHFDARKHVLEYDTVLNRQREAVYSKRYGILFANEEELVTLANQIRESLSEDSQKIFNEKENSFGIEAFHELVRRVALRNIDLLWMDHLDTMDHARRSVNLRAYGQREPLVEYKKEGLRLFRELEQNFVLRVGEYLLRAEAPPPELSVKTVVPQASMDGNEIVSNVPSETGSVQKIGRNEKITIIKGGERKEIKFKKFEEYEKEGWRIQE